MDTDNGFGDVIASSQADSSVFVALTAVNFPPIRMVLPLPPDYWVTAVAAGDFNGDRRIDVAALASTQNSASVVLFLQR